MKSERSSAERASEKTISKLMFRLLPIQILIAVIGVLNSIASTFFASNFLGVEAMGAVGLYAPIAMFVGSVNAALMGGATILCGQCMGKNELHKMRGVFSLDMAAAFAFSVIFSAFLFFSSRLGIAALFAKDESLRPVFSQYLAGQAVGVVPFALGSQLSAFLSLENRMRRNTAASLAFIAANILLNILFIQKLKMGVFGLALATSIGAWIFFLIQAQYFASAKSKLKFSAKEIRIGELKEIVAVGYPGALSNLWQTLRGFIVNFLLSAYVGAVGISAFCAANNLMMLAWCVPAGMVSVSRMVMSVGVGEEDRLAVTDVMRVMFKKFCLVNNIIAVVIIICARPFAHLFYKDIYSRVFMMTVWGFRLLPLCLAFGSILQHFVCYGQMSGKNVQVQLLSLLDGVVFVAGFSALLVPRVGLNGVYIANVLNGVFVFAAAVLYSIVCNRRFPKNMEDLIVMPKSFGASKDERLDLAVHTEREAVGVSRVAQEFLAARSVDGRRAFFAALALEEMAGNVVAHGFSKDKKKHSLALRVVHKNDDIILRFRDDCVLFDPEERLRADDGQDAAKNVGLKIVYGLAKSAVWQSIFGMNVLTIKF